MSGLAPLQSGVPDTSMIQLTAELLVVGIAAATAAGLVALAYRWYVRERVQTGLGVLFGLSVVAVYLGTTGALGAVISGQEGVLAAEDVLPNLAFFAVGAAGSSVGIRTGDAVGTDLFAATGGKKIDRDVSEIAQTVGRVTSVRLPAEIDDIVGYDPMPDATKETLADRRFLFPRRLTRAEVRERLVSRLKTDYGVGHIDLELNDDGSVEYLAIGSRAAGIGPTLPPATNAVAIRADPAHAASAGDLVQVWATDPLSRVLTGELRGVAGDVVTVAIDAGDTPKLDPATEYKLVTLPVQDRPDREFASLLRAAEETMGTVTIPENSELVGTTVGDLGVTVAAITREDAPPEPIPSRDRVLEAGDVIYAIAKPEALRHVEGAAGRQRAPEPVETAADEGTDSEETPDDTDGGDTSDDESGDREGTPDDSDGGDTPDAESTDRSDAELVADTGDAPTDGEEKSPAETPAETADGEPGTDDATDGNATNDTEAPTADAEATRSAETEPEGTDDESASPGDGTPDDRTESVQEESVTVWDPDERLDGDDPDGDTADDSADSDDDPAR